MQESNLLTDLQDVVDVVLSHVPTPAAVERLRRTCCWQGSPMKDAIHRRLCHFLMVKPKAILRRRKLGLSLALRDDATLVKTLLGATDFPSLVIEDVASPRLLGDAELMWWLIGIEPCCLRYASQKLRRDTALVWHAIERVAQRDPLTCGRGISLAWLDDKLRDDEEICYAVLRQKAAPYLEFAFVSWRLRNDVAFVSRVISKVHPCCLRHSSHHVRSQKKIALLAISKMSEQNIRQSDFVELIWLSATLRDDQQIVTTIVEKLKDKSSYTFGDASVRLRSNRQFVRFAVELDPRNLHFASLELRNDISLALTAASVRVKSDLGRVNLRRLGSLVRNDPLVHLRLATTPLLEF